MDNKVAVRYAKALFSLALEKNKLDEVRKDLKTIEIVSKSSDDLMWLLSSPVIKTSDKLRVLRAAFKDFVDPITLSFLELVARKKREGQLLDMARNFNSYVLKNKGITSVVFTSAVELPEALRKEVAQRIERSFKTIVEMEERVDPSLLGGFVLRVDDLQLDASVASKLNGIHRALADGSQAKI